jgi:PAS domain S-box-containing protein
MDGDTRAPDGPTRAEEALRMSDPLASALLECAPIGVVVVDERGTIVSVNASVEEMFGYGRRELLGRPLETLVPERLRAAHGEHRARYFGAPSSRPMGGDRDLIGRRADGREFPVEVSLGSVRVGEGTFGVGFIVDVTPRREAERRLRAEFALTRALADSATLADAAPRLCEVVCGVLQAPIGELWGASDAGAEFRWLGLWAAPGIDTTQLEAASRARAVTRGTRVVGRVWAARRPVWFPEARTEMAQERRAAIERLGLRAALGVPLDDGRATSGVMLFFTRDAQEPDEGVIRFLVDISSRIAGDVEHKRTQAELERQREALRRSERLASLGTLTAGLAHEMNNPLGIISSRLELMLMETAEQGLPASVVEDLQVLQRNARRVARLAEALRVFGRQTPRAQVALDLSGLVEETLRLVGKPFSIDGIEVVTALDPGLPRIEGDPHGLQQVLLNLLTNARDALGTGGTIHVETRASSSRQAVLVVSDTGPGIPPEVLPRIYDPFFTTKAQGTGLGLSISYGIVQDHRGTMEVSTEVGKGTTFVLTFPTLGAMSRPPSAQSSATGGQ